MAHSSWIVVCVSDTHQRHRELTQRLLSTHNGDIFLHAGDITNFGRGNQPLQDFDDWLNELPFRYKFVVGGNHETTITPILSNGYLLQNEQVIVDNSLRLFGASWRPVNSSTWLDIPENTHIVLTHNPPFSTFGPHIDLEHNLRCRLNKIKPLLSVFGHIHEDYGVLQPHDQSYSANCACYPSQRSKSLNDPLRFRIFMDQNSKFSIEHLK